MIERKHDKLGLIKLEMSEHTYRAGGKTIWFTFPDGQFMGEMDRQGFSGLGHPNQEINEEFLQRGLTLYAVDYNSYLDLEEILFKEVNKSFPQFFLK